MLWRYIAPIPVPWRVLQYLEYGAGGARKQGRRAEVWSQLTLQHVSMLSLQESVTSVRSAPESQSRWRRWPAHLSAHGWNSRFRTEGKYDSEAEHNPFPCSWNLDVQMPPTSLFVGKGLPLRRPCHPGFMPCWPACWSPASWCPSGGAPALHAHLQEAPQSAARSSGHVLPSWATPETGCTSGLSWLGILADGNRNLLHSALSVWEGELVVEGIQGI